MLEFLMRRSGEVVSKATILDHVWDFAFEGDPNIVEVYVRRLRNKVDRPFGRSSIATLRGSGYRLAADGG
jgi:DNA-binding response OmpR family regulator